jgi:PTS system mannose-specific IIB component/fructoselysine and glucoselysine-specific PTS system IIB component
MTVSLVRVDDRLIHGQVVVGWVQSLDARRIVLVDDRVRAQAWEQDIYRVGVPPGLRLDFASVDEAVAAVPEWSGARERIIVLVPDVETLVRLCRGAPAIERVNLGGLHNADGRSERAHFIYLSDREAGLLRELATRGVTITAQAVPSSRVIALEDLI